MKSNPLLTSALLGTTLLLSAGVASAKSPSGTASSTSNWLTSRYPWMNTSDGSAQPHALPTQQELYVQLKQPWRNTTPTTSVDTSQLPEPGSIDAYHRAKPQFQNLRK